MCNIQLQVGENFNLPLFPHHGVLYNDFGDYILDY